MPSASVGFPDSYLRASQDCKIEGTAPLADQAYIMKLVQQEQVVACKVGRSILV